MPQTYCRDDPVSGRWSGVNRLLTEYEVDDNFYTLISRVATLEADFAFTVSIAYITQHGNELTFHMTDHTTRGPFEIPIATFKDRGSWAPSTSYLVNDTTSINGTVYVVTWPHVSAGAFDPGANDGLGHNYYSPLLSQPGNSLPTGGAGGMYLMKVDGHDFHVTWGYPVPVGGTTGQYLVKASNSDFDYAWSSFPAISVESLSDFTFVSPHSVGDVISWNGSSWQNSQPISTLSTLTDVSVTEGSSIDGYTLNWNNGASKWEAVAPVTGRQTTVTALGTSGTVSIDASLGDLFTISPTADMIINGTPAAGAHVSLLITTTNTSGFKISFGSPFSYRGDIQLPKASSVSLSISFVCDGGTFYEVARDCDQQLSVLGTTGSVTLNPTFSELFTLTPTGDITLNANNAAGPGRRASIVLTTSGTTSRTITFGTNFKSTGTLATGTVSGKVFTVEFVSDGTNFNEVSRTVAM